MRPFSYSTITMLTAAVLLVMAGRRWHEAAVAQPDRIVGVDPPSAILLVQERDCPDRRAAMAAWLEDLRATRAGETLPVYLAALGNEAGSLDPRMDDLPRLQEVQTSIAARALLRAGLSGTPALLLLDDDGHVLMADTFATSGPGARLALAADLLPTVHSFTTHTGTVEPDGR